jgi:enoyl-CoA hydratase/carnithine racemase
MALADDIAIRRQGKAGRITLTRSQALNAMTYEMCLAIEQALIEWREDSSIALIVIDAEGDKAFCAGGDLESLYRTGKAGDFSYGRRFWTDEYRLNAMIAEYPKPYVALMQGFVMGGGVGIGCHGSHRIVCETTLVAMPECGIGLVPDVGGSWLLAHAPGHLGEYLGLSGMRMNAADAIHCGFADYFIARERWPELVAALCAKGDVSAIGAFVSQPGPSALASRRAEIGALFSAKSALDCLKACEAAESDFARDAVAAIRRGCPLSVACAFELIRRNRRAGSVREALANEYRFTWRSMSDGEFLEGIRAQIIDKDRKPRWRIRRLEDVTPAQVDTMLAPIVEMAA